MHPFPFRLKAAAATDIGRRRNNEDAYLINEKVGLFVVADGMGGHEKGEVASWFSSSELEKVMQKMIPLRQSDTLDNLPPLDEGKEEALLHYALLHINHRLYALNEKSFSLSEPSPGAGKKHMGTTLVSLFVYGNKVFITHVGDSRAYALHAAGAERLTDDHSWVEEQMRLGNLTAEEARHHKKRNVITRSVGFKPHVKADIKALSVTKPQRFLLCSDGLSGSVTESDLHRLAFETPLPEACEQLIQLAKAKGSTDNITVLLVDIEPKYSFSGK